MVFLSEICPKLVIELGMGDGRLLESLAKCNSGTVYIGIELNKEQCAQARSRITVPNVVILNSSFEDIIPTFQNESVDEFLIVLPDPTFVDQKKEEQWKPFYKTLYCKLKKQGHIQLVTELTDELLQPVSNDRYSTWANWLKSCFISLGFSLVDHHEGAPRLFSSRCIEQFRGDPERIRMITLDLVKQP
ncbi:MAG TPA: methyltransferase domain-containing protein [Nitrososphaera sp.]|nr:methyltransferase domain-containing protein [Nitrososphaera sp.]